MTEKAPLKLFERIFCQRCSDKEYWQAKTERKQLCILTLIADELAKTRQILQDLRGKRHE